MYKNISFTQYCFSCNNSWYCSWWNCCRTHLWSNQRKLWWKLRKLGAGWVNYYGRGRSMEFMGKATMLSHMWRRKNCWTSVLWNCCPKESFSNSHGAELLLQNCMIFRENCKSQTVTIENIADEHNPLKTAFI